MIGNIYIMFHLVCNGKSCLLTQRAFPKSLPASSHLHCAGPQSAVMRRILYIFNSVEVFSPGKTDPDFRPAPSPGKERNWFGLQVELLVELPKHGILWKCVLYWITPTTMVSPFLLDFLLLKWNCSHTAKHPRGVSESRWIKINYIQKVSNFFTQYLKKWISPVIRNLLTTLRRK